MRSLLSRGFALSSALIVLALPSLARAEGRVLTLEEALQLAHTHQPQLQVAQAQVGVAQARVGEAKSGFLPRLDTQAQYQRATSNFELTPLFVPIVKRVVQNYQAHNTLSPNDTLNFYAFGVTASQLLFDFGKTPGVVMQAEASADATRADARLAAQNVALNVRVAYYSALAARQLVELGERTLANQRRHVEQVRHFVEQGSRARFDLSSAELNLANVELALVRARDAFALAKLRLRTAIGLDSFDDFDLAEPPEASEAPETASAQSLVETAREKRPEMARLDGQLTAQHASKRIARAGYLPVVSGVGNVSGTQVQGFGAGYDWYVGATLNWNLFNGLLTTKQAEEADAAIAAATAQREATRQTIRAEVEEQLLAAEDAGERQRVAARAVATARERLQQAEDRYQTGAGDALELDDAQVTLTNAESQQVQARYDLAIARARLLRAVGSGSPGAAR